MALVNSGLRYCPEMNRQQASGVTLESALSDYLGFVRI